MDTRPSHTTVLRAQLGGLKRALGAIAAVAATTATDQRAVAHGVAARQQVLNAILSCVTLVEQPPGSRRHADRERWRVTDLSPDVRWVDVERAHLQGPQALDVIVEVQASAQLGGLLLSFGAPDLFSTMTIRVAGQAGVREMTFASGTSLVSLGAAVRAIGESAGFSATVRQTGVRVESTEMGSDRFVAVKVVGIGRTRPGAGIYRLRADDFETPDPALGIPFASPAASHWLVDAGSDVSARVNGRAADGVGPALTVRTGPLRASFELTVGPPIGTGNAQTLGVFRAFTIRRSN